MLQQTFMAEQESGLFLLTSKDHNVRMFTPRHAQYIAIQYPVTLSNDSVMKEKKTKNKNKNKKKKRKNRNKINHDQQWRRSTRWLKTLKTSKQTGMGSLLHSTIWDLRKTYKNHRGIYAYG